MAQDELTRLQNSLANYQAKNTSGQYTNTVANLQSKINDLTKPSYTGDPTITPGANNPSVPSGTPIMGGSVTPKATAVYNQVPPIVPNASSGTNIPSGAPSGTNTPGIPSVTPTTGVNAPATSTGLPAPTGVQTGAQPPPAAQVAQPPQNLALRDVATAAGKTVENVGNVPTIDGKQIDPAKAGLQLVDGRWQGAAGQIGTALGVPVGLREGLEAAGRKVVYDPNTGQVLVNDIPVNTAGMVNIDGRYYTTQDMINRLVAGTGGQVALGSEFPLPKDLGVTKGQAGEKTGEKPFDNSIQARLDEEIRKNKELQAKADALEKEKVPKKDFTETNRILQDLGNKKGKYDQDIADVLQKTFEGFNYDPANDPMLQKAVKYANRSMMEEMNRRGILDSSITFDNERYLYEDLLPTYQDMAFQRYNQELSNNFKKIEVMQSLNRDDYERYKTFVTFSMDTAEKISQNTVDTVKDNMTVMQNALTNQIAINKADAEAKAEAYKNAWMKFKEIGYVDNEIATLINLPVGTRSKEAEAEMLKRYDEYNKLRIEFQNSIDKMDYQHNLNMKEIDVAKKEKDIVEERKKKAGAVLASLGNMSATQALDEVSKNFATLLEYLGSELGVLVDNLKAQKVIESKDEIDRQQLALQGRQVDISQQNADTAAKNAEKKEAQLSTAERNQVFANTYNQLKSVADNNVNEAITELESGAADYIEAFGVAGYRSLWNEVLRDAIKDGKVKAMTATPNAPKDDPYGLTAEQAKAILGGK